MAESLQCNTRAQVAPTFTKKLSRELIKIAKHAGLEKGEEGDFTRWLSDLPVFALYALGRDNTPTRSQRIKALEGALNALNKAANLIARDCPGSFLLPYYMEQQLREFEQRDERLPRETASLVSKRYNRDMATLEQLPLVLELAIERARESPLNCDEIARSNSALRASEQSILSHIDENWRQLVCRQPATSLQTIS